MKTDIHIRRELDEDSGLVAVCFEANVRDSIDDCNFAYIVEALADGISSFAKNNKIPVAAIATLLLYSVGCMEEEDANEAMEAVMSNDNPKEDKKIEVKESKQLTKEDIVKFKKVFSDFLDSFKDIKLL